MSKRVQTVGMLLALTSMAIGGGNNAYAGTVTAPNAAQNMQQDAACKGVVKDATGEPLSVYRLSSRVLPTVLLPTLTAISALPMSRRALLCASLTWVTIRRK